MKYDFDTVSANLPALLQRPARHHGAGLRAVPGGLWHQDGHVALRPVLAAGRAPGRAFAGQRHAFRRDDQDRRLRPDALFPLAGAGRARRPITRWRNGAWSSRCSARSRCSPAPCRRSSRSRPSACWPSTASARSATSCWAPAPAWPCCRRPAPNAPTLAAIGLLGALFHVLNHGLFKALLFLNAGSMLHATGTQDLNKMGGLMKFMPLTAITALVASFSISGVPLFNGFVSKWSIYVAAVQGSGSAKYLARVRRHRHPDQRADPGLVHQVLRRELPVAHQRAGDRAGGRARAGSKSAG